MPGDKANRARAPRRATKAHSVETLAKLCFAGLVLVTGSILAACESSSSSSGENGSFEAGPGFDAPRGELEASAAADASTPSLEGVWEGPQNGATVELLNAGGCTLIRNVINGTVCDECAGTYVVSSATTASTVVKCQPIAACSVSPPHTNKGTFTRGDGGALTYFYDYGFGTATLVVEPTQRAPGDVCRLIDAGASD